GKEKLVNRDISRESRQKSILENAHRTAASEQGGGYRTAALQGGGFVTEVQEAKERGKKGKIKGAGAKRGMRD
ncbi:hypothetical protein KI387_028354, partial [Taxus chinensis]